MATAFLVAGLALALALLLAVIAIHRKLDAIPARIWSIARRERDQDESKALTVLTEAAAVKVAALTLSLRTYEEQIAADLRAQVAAAQTRARVIEHRSSDAAIALSAASELVSELAAIVAELSVQRPLPPAPLNAPQGNHARQQVDPSRARRQADEDHAEARPTVEMTPRPAAAHEDDEPEDELTTVTTKPLAGTPSATNGLRLVEPRRAIPPPPKSHTRREGPR